jgi:lactoylglutathione lyase
MHIEHIAIWTNQLEVQKTFYAAYFSAHVGSKYTNPNTRFESYFLTFTSGARLEIMQAPRCSNCPGNCPDDGIRPSRFFGRFQGTS